MIVVADTSPINYLVLIDQAAILNQLYGEVVLPPAVHAELTAAKTPEKVKSWLKQSPPWLRIEPVEAARVATVSADLDPGEREAIALAETLGAAYLIMDDQKGRQQALCRKLNVIGTLGVLDRAGQQGLITDFPDLLSRLDDAGFRTEAGLREVLLQRHRLWPGR
jgi:predicted nucleic acid-binding protein